jgi:uncharacterized protein YndB with AHSA1/START domain
MIDVIQNIDAIQREVGTGTIPAGEGHVVRLRRDYDAPIDDVWDALTNPARIGRWFLPISGDFRLGGSYQFEGNAGGRILDCERPERLHVTWEYGPGEPSEIELRLTPVGDDVTTFELIHTAVVPDEFWDQFGPGAVGVGWDMAVLGMALHLATGATVDDPVAWQLSDEGKDFARRSSDAWGAASIAAGADPEAAARAVAATLAFYTTVPEEGDPVAG